MKKQLIAAAVAAALAAPAMAQNVTISGTLDIGLVETRSAEIAAANLGGGAAAQARADSYNTGENSGFSTSTINFSGTEDLGGGLKAGFFWNQTINADSGEEGAREGYLTLDGSFGQLKFGRFVPAGEATLGGHITGTTLQQGTIDPIFAWDTADIGRQGGNLQWSSPEVNGFKVVAGLNAGQTDVDGTAGSSEQKQYDFALSYKSGKLGLAVAHTLREMSAEGAAAASAATLALNANSSGEIELTSLNASYDFGAALVKASYFQHGSAANNAQLSKVDGWQLGATFPMGAWAPYVSIYSADDEGDGAAASQVDLKGYQLGTTYSLSKRTSLYAVVGKDSVDLTNAELEVDGYVIGIRHTF